MLKESLWLPGCLRCLLGFGVGSSQKGLVKDWIYLKDLSGLHHHGVQIPVLPSALLSLKCAVWSLKPLEDEPFCRGETEAQRETIKKSDPVPLQMGRES